MAETKQVNIEQLVYDDRNFNKHTEYGMSLLEKSLRNNGAGRSILIDKNNRIIGGNGVVETAVNIGMDKVRIIETDGTELIAVKRKDIDLDSKQGREMALADNATASADLQWDVEALDEVGKEYEIDTEDWGVFLPTEIAPDEFFDDDNSLDNSKDKITITLPNELSSKKDEILNTIKKSLEPFNGLKIQ